MNQRPNLILITIDALRADHLGFMGYEKDTSPNIDSLAKESIVFKNAFAVGPTTPYSFPSILTSTYPLDYQGPREIKKPRVFISEVFKKKGFITAAFHSSPYLSDYFGYDKGWDFFKDINFSVDFSSGSSRLKKLFNKIMISTFPELFFRMAYLRYRMNRPQNVRVKASLVNQVARDFIYTLKEKNQPFFIWIHYMDTHTPPLCYSENRVCSYTELLGDYVGAAIWSHGNKGALKRFVKKRFKKYLGETLSLYDKAIKSLDKEIGELLNFLKKQNIYQDSVLCVTSDHGDEFLEHGGLGHNIQLYNEVLSIPLLIKMPENNSMGIPAGQIIEKNVSLIDLTPTLCDLVGIEKDPTFKGKNLFNENASLVFHQSAFSEKEGHRLEIERLDQCRVACQFDNWKYILDHGTGKEELYNLSKDPKEKNNVFSSEPGILSQMKEKVKNFEKENPPLSLV